MAQDIKLWKGIKTQEGIDLKEVPSKSLSDLGLKEEDLRQLILNHPEIISDDLTIIGKEIDSIDILGINKDGTVVVIETKRNEPRGALAQVIDYASFVSEQDEEWLRDKAKEKEVDLQEFEEGIDLENPQMFIIGTVPDEDVERMVRFLSKYEMDINLVILRCHRDEQGNEYLTRTYSLSEETKKELAQYSKSSRRKWDELSFLAEIERRDDIKGKEKAEKVRHLIEKVKERPELYFEFSPRAMTKNPSMMIKHQNKTFVYLSSEGNLQIFKEPLKKEGETKASEFFETLKTLGFKEDKTAKSPCYKIEISKLTEENLDTLMRALVDLSKP